MSHILITFLGKGDTDTDGLYQHEQYRFENDDTPYYETNFFCLAVLEHLKNKGSPPDKLVILGTPSSMWNALYEIKGEVEDDYEDEWVALADAIEENTEYPEEEEIEEEKITEYFPTLQKFLTKYLEINCELRVIPYGESQEKQIVILEKIAESVKENDTVSLDITHGSRHLPMLVIVSAMYLEIVKKVTIADIYYGAMEMKNRHNGIAPALNLKGMLGIANWFGALKSFEKDGDYGVFADLLETDGLTKNQTKPLKDAAFFERIFNISQAARKLTTFRNNVQEDLPGIGYLFTDTLKNRIKWSENNSLYGHQRALAFSFLEKKDYFRATNLAVEAFITKLMLMSGDNPKEDIRYRQRIVADYFLHGKAGGDRGKISDFRLLRKLRNMLVHSDMLQSEIERIIESNNPQQSLESTLRKLMKHLLD